MGEPSASAKDTELSVVWLALTIVLAAALLVALAAVFFVSQSYKHIRSSFDKGAEASDPGALGLPFETLDLRTSDGLRLRAWLIPAASGTARSGSQRAVVGVHGAGDGKQYYLPLVPALHAAGLAVLLFDGRCHGESDVSRWGFTLGAREQRDVAAAVDFLADRGFDRIAGIAASQGGAALAVAAAGDARIETMVLESSAHDLSVPYRVIFRRAPRAFHRFLAVVTAIGFWGFHRESWRGFGQQHRAVADFAPRPVLLIYGDRDPVIPLEVFDAYFARMSTPKESWLVRGGRHCVLRFRREEFASKVVDFLDRAGAG